MTEPTTLEALSIVVRNGLLTSPHESLRINDIQRFQVEGGLTPFGYLIALSQFTEVRISLIAYGSFGRAVVSKSEFINSLWFRKRVRAIRQIYELAKSELDDVLADPDLT